MAESPTAKQIRKHVAAERGPEEGAVVRFKRHVPERQDQMSMQVTPARELTYVGLFVGGRWYLTGHTGRQRPGQPEGTRIMRNRALMEFIATDDVYDVEVAASWELVEA